MLNYKKWQTNEDKQKFKIEVQKDKVRGIIDSIKTKGKFYLEFNDVYKILQCYGLPIIESVSVIDESEAVKASQQLGFPVVIKCIGKELIHKSDVGGVKLDIKNTDELLSAIKEIKNSLILVNQIDKLEGFLIQPFFKGGIETILGVFKDKDAGHLIMFGLGGIMVEIMKDVKFRLIPITENDAFDMIKSIKGYKILEGFRGNKGIDINFLAENLMRLSKLIEDFPEIQEMDLNPFVFSNNHQKCKILDSRIKFLL
jgi:acyl-CoA synthetase (NDP forming)